MQTRVSLLQLLKDLESTESNGLGGKRTSGGGSHLGKFIIAAKVDPSKY